MADGKGAPMAQDGKSIDDQRPQGESREGP